MGTPLPSLNQEPFEFSFSHDSLTSSEVRVVLSARRKFVIDRAIYVNDAGLAEDAANFFAISLAIKEPGGAFVQSHLFSTETGEGGTIAAATPTTVPKVGVATGSALSQVRLSYTESGTATLPTGRLQVEGRYL